MPRLFTALAIACTTFLFAGTADAKGLFKATLSGDQEVPNPVDAETGGKAFFRVDKAQSQIEIQLHVQDGLGITQAHIHCAPAGVNGPVVVFLAGFHSAGLDVDGKWVSNAVITDASIVNDTCGETVAELVESMQAGDTYVNVHSIAFPGGVVRGQIAPTR